MCIACNYVEHMARMIQVRNVPDTLHRTLKSRAALAGMSLSDYLLNELRLIAERPTMEEMRRRLHQLEPVVLPESAADAVRAEREAR
jgi:antitoxin FitA